MVLMQVHPRKTGAASGAYKTYYRSWKRKYNGKRQRNKRTGGFVGQELKYVDYEYNGTISTTVAAAQSDPATALSLSATAQGDGAQQRLGRRVKWRRVHIRGNVLFSAQSDVTGHSVPIVRLILFVDTQTNGSQANPAEVLHDPTDTNLDVLAQRNLEFTDRFKVIRDMTLVANGQNMTSDGQTANNFDVMGQMIPFEMHIDLKKWTATQKDTTAAIGNLLDNSLHMIAIAGASGTSLRYTSRLRFEG